MSYVKNSICIAVLVPFIVFSIAIHLRVPQVHAAAAGNTYMRCDRMKASTNPGNCLVVFTTSATAATETSIKITLDAEWVSTTNFSTTAGNYTVSTAGLPAGVTAMPGIATADLVSSNTIRFPVTALTDSTTYGFFITNGGTGLISNPAASTTIIHTIFTRTGADADTADTKDVAVPTISDDQIAVTANVAPTFTFAFANNLQALGTMTTSGISSGTGTGITITTNSASGWTAWVKSANAGLTSTNATYTIATTGTVNAAPSSLSAGTEGYVLDVNLTTDAGSGGTVTIDAEYNGADTSSGGTLSTSFQPIASSTGAANGDVITVMPRAAISGLTEAASDYADTLTVVGSGIF
ncbi:hypothetical protein KBD71_01555 [Candidatus Woesebacteria bacterium]|nr:hypothetical protein [Candidatus Woesebacteria bacterium]